MIVPCECGAKLKIDDAKIATKGVKVRCPRCGNIIQVPPASRPLTSSDAPPSRPACDSSQASGSLVLVAHDSAVVREMVCDVLSGTGFQTDIAVDGVDALKKAAALRPAVIIVDVGLPGIYGFELCDRLKNNAETSGIKIILLASVYDATRYKRTPVSLYGADDYIEKHHIPDKLARKVSSLLFPEPEHKDAAEPPPEAREFDTSFLNTEIRMQPGASEPFSGGTAAPAPPFAQGGQGETAGEWGIEQTHGHEHPTISPDSLSLDSSIFQKEEYDMPAVNEADPEAVEKAKRFARIIVSDIALYNQDAVAQGINEGTFYNLLSDDIAEGRDLYDKRVPAAIKEIKDFYQEAFDNFIAAQKNVR